jgi:hypothetical protein
MLLWLEAAILRFAVSAKRTDRRSWWRNSASPACLPDQCFSSDSAFLIISYNDIISDRTRRNKSGTGDNLGHYSTCPMPLSKVTDVALVELQVSVVDEPRMIEVACAVSVNVGAGCGPGVDCGAFEQAVKATTSSRVATSET